MHTKYVGVWIIILVTCSHKCWKNVIWMTNKKLISFHQNVAHKYDIIWDQQKHSHVALLHGCLILWILQDITLLALSRRQKVSEEWLSMFL